MHRIISPEKYHAYVRKQIEEHEQNDSHKGDRTEAADKRLNNDAQLREGLDELQDS